MPTSRSLTLAAPACRCCLQHPPFPTSGSRSCPPGFQRYTEITGNLLSGGVEAARSNNGFHAGITCAPPAASAAARGSWRAPCCCAEQRPWGWGNTLSVCCGREEVPLLPPLNKAGSADPGPQPQPSLRRSAASAEQACWVPVRVPPPRTPWPSGCLRPAEHLESWRPPAAAVAEGGWRAIRLSSERQGGTSRGPVPASRGESRLRVINGFPGSRAGAGARAGRRPAQHPGRLARLSSPTSFAPSSGDEPPWSLQALRTRTRGTGCLSRPAWLSCSPPRGCPRLPQLLPRYRAAGSTHSPAVRPSPPRRTAGSGLQYPSDCKTPSLPYSPGC